ncbi:hypothetical protein [Hyalangium versicolor]|uniref:hypothetical protein n=1 Tax=Hyalangium versicolor TaxID=2861190 RepID=UPI001CCCE658|nr:hypothetical protein [Hyalangium versicolor]
MTKPLCRASLSFVLSSLLLASTVARAESPIPQEPETPATQPAAEPVPPTEVPVPAVPEAPAAPVVPPTPAAPSSTPAAPTEEQLPVLTALYPLWENTARVLQHRSLYLGTSNAEFGLFGVAQLGTRPLSFIFRTPNIHAKLRLLSRERLEVAAHAEVVVFLPGSSEAFTSSNYISRLDTRDILLTVVPVGATASFQIMPWLYLHGTTTVMGMFDDGPYLNRLVLGINLVAEFLALQHHSVRVHASEVGFWDHDFNMLGASYCYRRSWFEFQVGYYYRFFGNDGRQTSPLIALGAYL